MFFFFLNIDVRQNLRNNFKNLINHCSIWKLLIMFSEETLDKGFFKNTFKENTLNKNIVKHTLNIK